MLSVWSLYLAEIYWQNLMLKWLLIWDGWTLSCCQKKLMPSNWHFLGREQEAKSLMSFLKGQLEAGKHGSVSWQESEKSKYCHKMQVKLELDAKPLSLKQYPLKDWARWEYTAFLEYQLTWPCNTPILPLRKPGREEHRFVQDLRAIRQIYGRHHPVVLNAYTLLTTLSGTFAG